jgi:hypothetical protein
MATATRPTERPVQRAAGLSSAQAERRLEIGMVALLAYTPGIDDVFHTSALSGWEWLFLLVWPALVFAAEELRKALVRRRAA